MDIQKSFDDEAKGAIYVVPTPIGNLEDITFRALKILGSVSIIAAEDTRNTKNLLNHFEITTSLISYHEHNKMAREDQLLERVENGESVAIVSDAGMPAISDPGYELVQAATSRGQSVVVLPGANAALCALVGSGLSTDTFYFYGFLPRKKKEKIEALNQMKAFQATLLFYESPYRLKDTLKEMLEQLGNRQIVIARELTKRFEEYARGTVEELISWAEGRELKGEFCIVLEGNPEQLEPDTALWWSHLSVTEHVNHYIEERHLSSKEAIKQASVDRKMPKRAVYQAFHVGT
ncbi:16S rRNA (cytidine1402-2'-O)-methyltransferase [Virgibacillus natechei]|uniref:Ribosomal RNA small subunit methyltransferase I n=1 Tax=Virgibacillus natechei TaxID=1216297 RepID=A0ABS4IHB1_9BACI|nr:16S rRNA (cytidine(1402)-2'-O)-methyltransferase [Virgibacillus natechei]MBP1970339.1 16S rRNA (cytidine1402-2'-O)-methyltransferase [Virgibacillus natechei]UZD13166.1 16S rRNA (cytidine(1402)-2'-O)-methyltransferase [Virgibacillus natechei]